MKTIITSIWVWIASLLSIISNTNAFAPHHHHHHRSQFSYYSCTSLNTATSASTTEINDFKAPGIPMSSRRRLLNNASSIASIMILCNGSNKESASASYIINQIDPNERDIYTLAQSEVAGRTDTHTNKMTKNTAPLSILWVGSGTMNGVFKDLFQSGSKVTALDLCQPERRDIQQAKTYAKQHGYDLRFIQGDATHLQFPNESFDVVVCSLFLCQDFDPEVVVTEIRRVLKMNGRFGFYEHVEDIDKVIVGKVFGDEAVVQVQYCPDVSNIMAGVVVKV